MPKEQKEFTHFKDSNLLISPKELANIDLDNPKPGFSKLNEYSFDKVTIWWRKISEEQATSINNLDTNIKGNIEQNDLEKIGIKYWVLNTKRFIETIKSENLISMIDILWKDSEILCVVYLYLLQERHGLKWGALTWAKFDFINKFSWAEEEGEQLIWLFDALKDFKETVKTGIKEELISKIETTIQWRTEQLEIKSLLEKTQKNISPKVQEDIQLELDTKNINNLNIKELQKKLQDIKEIRLYLKTILDIQRHDKFLWKTLATMTIENKECKFVGQGVEEVIQKHYPRLQNRINQYKLNSKNIKQDLQDDKRIKIKQIEKIEKNWYNIYLEIWREFFELWHWGNNDHEDIWFCETEQAIDRFADDLWEEINQDIWLSTILEWTGLESQGECWETCQNTFEWWWAEWESEIFWMMNRMMKRLIRYAEWTFHRTKSPIFTNCRNT